MWHGMGHDVARLRGGWEDDRVSFSQPTQPTACWMIAGRDVATVIDAAGHVVAPGFVDPHGHSDGSVFLDGALVSHLRQGYTTQLSGNCGYTFAPLTAACAGHARRRPRGARARPAWTTFAGFLDAVEAQPLGPNVAFLVGHGTVRSAVLGPDSRAPERGRAGGDGRAMSTRRSRPGAVGVSSGLIYAPGMHARPDEVAALVAAAARRDGLYATHMRNESAGVLGAIDEAISTARAAGELAGRPARLQVSHLKAGARSMWGMADALVERLERPARAGLDVAADQYPYTAAATTLATVLPPAILALDRPTRSWPPSGTRPPGRGSATSRREGISGWENVTADPGWAGIVIAHSDVATRVGGPIARGPRGRRSAATRPTSRSTSSPTTGSRSTSSSTAWPSPTSRRSCACPGSRSARTPRAVAPATRSSTPAFPTRGPTARRRACSGSTCGSAGSSTSRRPSRS